MRFKALPITLVGVLAATSLTATSASAAQIGTPSRGENGELTCKITLDAGEQAYFDKISANINTPELVRAMQVAHRAAYPDWNAIAERLDKIPGYRQAMVDFKFGTATQSQRDLLERALAKEGLTLHTKGSGELINHALLAAAETNPSVLNMGEITSPKVDKVTTVEPPAFAGVDIVAAVMDNVKISAQHEPVVRPAVEQTPFYKAFQAYYTQYDAPLRQSYRACAKGQGATIPYPTYGLASDLRGNPVPTPRPADDPERIADGDGQNQTVVIVISVIVSVLVLLGLVAALPQLGVSLPFAIPFQLPL